MSKELDDAFKSMYGLTPETPVRKNSLADRILNIRKAMIPPPPESNPFADLVVRGLGSAPRLRHPSIIPPPVPPPLRRLVPPLPATAPALSVEWCNGVVRKLLAEKPNIAAGRALPDIDSLAIMEGRRVNAAFVYSDLHGFSKLVATQLEENSFRFLQVFVKVASDLTKHYGGQVMDVAGDRVLSVFHRPTGNQSNEPVEDAVTFALCLQTLFAKSISPAFGGSQSALSVAIGIDYGEVVVGCVGVREGKRIVFFGNAANNAAKLQDAATGGETILSNVAYGMRPNYLKGSTWTPKLRIVPGLMPVISITQHFAGDQPAKAR